MHLEHRRVVVLDIETVALDPADEKGALNALTGRIVCIGELLDEDGKLTERALIDEDEHRLLEYFWASLRPSGADLLIGHNILEFDLPFIHQRSWILGVPRSRQIDMRRYYTGDVVDTLQLWTNWSFRNSVKLDTLSQVLGCGQKNGNGKDVAKWWAERDFGSITRYCLEDVRITHRVFCRLAYRQPAQPVAN
jgi:DNA polymerase III epsilon subunit-like protein